MLSGRPQLVVLRCFVRAHVWVLASRLWNAVVAAGRTQPMLALVRDVSEDRALLPGGVAENLLAGLAHGRRGIGGVHAVLGLRNFHRPRVPSLPVRGTVEILAVSI